MSRFVLPQESTFNINGLPQVAATLDFHNVGLLTDKDTFPTEADAAAGTNANTNPVIADASGNFGNIWLVGDYDVTLKNEAGVTIWGPEEVQSFSTSSSSNFIDKTLAQMKSDPSPIAGQSVYIVSDRASGIFDTISGTGSANEQDIVAHDTLSFSFVLRIDFYYFPRRMGMVADWNGSTGTDDSPVWQRVIDLYKANPKPIIFDGDSKLSTGLIYQTSGTSQGLDVRGLNGVASSWVADFDNDAVIEIDGSSLTPDTFQVDGGFSNFTITQASGRTGVVGILCNGWQKPIHNHFNITALSDDAISIPLRVDIAANVDEYNSTAWTLNSCLIDFIAGFGFNGGNNQGHAGWRLNNTRINSCDNDGLSVHASGWKMSGGSLAANGLVSGGGIGFSGGTGFTPSGIILEQVEFDTNKDYHISSTKVGDIQASNCRFITKRVSGSDIPLKHVILDNSNAINSINFYGNTHRIDTLVLSAITLFDVGVGSNNISSMVVENYLVQNDAAVSITEFTAGADSKRLVRIIKNDGRKQRSDLSGYGFSGATGQSITSTATTIDWNVDVKNMGHDGDLVAGVLTAPYEGFYNIGCFLTPNTIADGVRVRIQFFKNTSLHRDFYFDGGTTTGFDRQTLQAQDIIELAAGDTFEIKTDTTGSTLTLFGSTFTSRLFITGR